MVFNVSREKVLKSIIHNWLVCRTFLIKWFPCWRNVWWVRIGRSLEERKRTINWNSILHYWPLTNCPLNCNSNQLLLLNPKQKFLIPVFWSSNLDFLQDFFKDFAALFNWSSVYFRPFCPFCSYLSLVVWHSIACEPGIFT